MSTRACSHTSRPAACRVPVHTRRQLRRPCSVLACASAHTATRAPRQHASPSPANNEPRYGNSCATQTRCIPSRAAVGCQLAVMLRLNPPPVNRFIVARASCTSCSAGWARSVRRISSVCCSRRFCSKNFFLTSRSSFVMRPISCLYSFACGAGTEWRGDREARSERREQREPAELGRRRCDKGGKAWVLACRPASATSATRHS